MKLTLRKAASVQSAIAKAIQEIELKGTVRVSIHKKSSASEIATAQKTLLQNLQKINKLEGIQTSIRQKVGQVNSQIGICDMLAEDSMLTNKLARLNKVIKFEECLPTDELELEIKLLREQSKSAVDRYMRAETSVNTGVLNSNDFDKLKNEVVKIRRRKVEIADQLLALNVKHEIDISASEYEMLETERVL